jgi:uncharacterized ion transporter superfamily protein YfcC
MRTFFRRLFVTLIFLMAIAMIIGLSQGDELYYIMIGAAVLFALAIIAGLVEKLIRRMRRE